MKHNLLVLFGIAACSLALAFAPACDSDGNETTADVPAAGDQGPDTSGDTTPQTPEYSAVYIVDTFDGTCKSTNNADGANIDTVGHFDSAQDLIGYAAFIRSEALDTCGNDYTDENEALGAPDGTLLENYLTLQGGWMIVEFEGQTPMAADDVITVFEVGSEVSGKDDPYDVYVATDLTCGGDANPMDADPACTVKLGDGVGEGNFTLPATLF